MISRITLTNFKKHAEGDFAFDEGLSAIVGENAIGKSTILKAAVWGLLNTGAGVKNSIPTRNSSKATTVTVEITLPKHGEVVVTRSLSNAKVHKKSGELLANGITPVTKLIEEAYGMSSADLLLLMYSQQGQSQALLELGATALQKLVERLSKSELVDRVLTMIGSEISYMDGELKGAGHLSSAEALAAAKADSQQVEQSHGEQVRRVRVLEEVLNDDSGREEELKEQYLAEQAQHNLWVSLNNRLTYGIEQQALHQGKADELRSRSGRPAALVEVEYNAAVADNALLRSTIGEHIKTLELIEMHQTQSVTLVKRAETLAQRVGSTKAAEQEIAVLEAQLKELIDQRSGATTAFHLAQNAWKAARAALDSSVCQECKRPYDEAELAAVQITYDAACEAKEATSQAMLMVETPIVHAEDQLKALRKQAFPGSAEDLADVQQQMRECGVAIGKLLGPWVVVNSLRDQVDEERRALTEGLELEIKLQNEWDAQRKLEQDLAGMLERLATTAEEIASLQQELDGLPKGDYVNELFSNWQAYVSRTKQLESDLADSRQVLARLEQRADDQRWLVEQSEQANARRVHLEVEIARRKALNTWLRKSRSDLMQELWDGLFHFASGLLSTTTEGKLRRVFRADDEILVDEEGYVASVAELSGFQRSLVGLALRIGLARVFYGADLPLLLDEPTADARDDNAARVGGMLRSLNSQVIMVTHNFGDAVNATSLITL